MKQLRINEIEGFLFGRFEVRVNIINNSLESRLKGSTEPFEPINESDLKYKLFKEGFSKFDGELKAILGSNIVAKYDPFREYFEGLPIWKNNQTDHIQHLSTFVKTTDQKWFELMFKKMLVRVVSQSLGTPQFNKQCFTFVGKQGDGKTSFFDFLVPNKLKTYYKKNYDFHGGRQSKFSLVQNFLINLDELAQFDKKDLNNEFKATLSENYVKYAPLFSSTEVSFARRASFVATTNECDFLSDATGSVRWVIFQVLQINHDNGGANGYAQINMDNVWAQAYSLYKDGFKGELDNDDLNQNSLMNRQFMRISGEMEAIAKHFKPSTQKEQNSVFHTASTIEMRLKEKGYNKLYVGRIGGGLKMLGFQVTSKWNGDLKYTEKGFWLVEVDF